MEKQPGKRPLIGVVTARVAEKEQRMLLGGIMHRAEQLGMDVAVFSNIYNFQEYFAGTQVENRIYELAGSPRIDGLILTAESILNPELQQQIYKIITERGVPVVVNGAELPGMTCLNNDVVQDFDDIGEHVAGVHGFTEVDFLTGYKEVETSHQRAQGLRRALQRHGAELPEENIIYGDFWMFSGEKLALDYI
ncbi:MAG: LacI family transcriptional regulator, partial [Oscillospiraceae bacterium]|nr:LacI family transcriptional regulator [Oscillospiraceae bacterium]